MFLVWLFVGIPVPVGQVDIAVPLLVNDKTLTDKQLQTSQVTLQSLNEEGSPIPGQIASKYTVLNNKGQRELVFRLGGTLLFNRIPFGWKHHLRSYQLTIAPKGDLANKYQPLQDQKVDVDLAASDRPLFGPYIAVSKEPVSLTPVYGAKLSLIFDLPHNSHPKTVNLTFTATNKKPLQIPIVLKADQRTYAEDVSALVGDNETADIAIDAVTDPDGYMASGIAANVTRSTTPTQVTLSGFKKPEVTIPPPVIPSTAGPVAGPPTGSAPPPGGAAGATPASGGAFGAQNGGKPRSSGSFGGHSPAAPLVQSPNEAHNHSNNTHSMPQNLHPIKPAAIDIPSRLCERLGVPVRTDNPLGISLQTLAGTPSRPTELAFDIPSRQPCYYQLYSFRGGARHPLLMYIDDGVASGPTTRTLDPSNEINEMAWTTADWEAQKPTDDAGLNTEIQYVLIAVSQDVPLSDQDRKDLIKAINNGISNGSIQPNQWSITGYKWKR